MKRLHTCVTQGAYFAGWGYMRFWQPGADTRERRRRADVAHSKGHGESEEQLFRGRVNVNVMEVA